MTSTTTTTGNYASLHVVLPPFLDAQDPVAPMLGVGVPSTRCVGVDPALNDPRIPMTISPGIPSTLSEATTSTRVVGYWIRPDGHISSSIGIQQ